MTITDPTTDAVSPGAAVDATDDLVIDLAVADAPPIAGPSRSRQRLARIAWGLIGLAGFVAAWALAASRVPGLASPADTWAELVDLSNGAFQSDGPDGAGIGLELLASLQRVFLGFGLAAIVGVPVGLAMGCSPRTMSALNPIVQFLRPVSPLAWFPIWLIVFKDAPQAAVWVIFITTLWPIILNTSAGAAHLPSAERDVARVFRFGRGTYLRHIVIPNTLPSIVTGLRLSMGIAWMVIVAVEMLSGGTGIGFFIWDAYNALNLAAVCAAIVLIGLIGLVLDTAFLRLSRVVALPETSR